VAKIGPYAGNTADIAGTEPAHTAVIDYFFNTGSRINPEDGGTNTVTTSVVGSGTVTMNPVQNEYACNAPVQLTATANPGWTFSGWSGALTGSTNPATLTVSGDHAVTATFTQNEYTLTVNTTGSGSVTRNPEKATYHLGDQVTLTAAAETGWAFSEWSGGASGSTNPVTVTINGNTTVNAAFIHSQYTLTVNKVGGGSVQVNPPGPFNYDDTIILTATADPNWAFSGWSGNISGSENPKVIKITGDTTVTANFVSTIKKIFIPLVVR
jgi:hypothetical protein